MLLTSLERQKLSIFLEYHWYIDEGHGCGLWKLDKYPDGYGRIWFRGKDVRVHRLAYAVFIGDFEDNLDVLHRCDVKHCYYSEHLFLGTDADNVADMIAKGRDGFKGEKNGRTKLHDYQIPEIKTKYEVGLSSQELAKEYSVSIDTIQRIVSGRAWKHIQRV